MSGSISKFLSPCLSNQPLYEEGFSSSKAHGCISIAIAILAMLGAATPHILSGSTISYLNIGLSAPLTGLISYLFLRCAFGRVDTLSLYFNSLEDTCSDRDLVYERDLNNEEKLTIRATNEIGNEFRFGQALALSVRIRNDDIFQSRSDAIVTDERCHDDKQIQKKGGRQYRKELWELHQSSEASGQKRGAATVIGCGELSKTGTQVVIVVAGPRNEDDFDTAKKTLFNCYYNSLVLANSHNMKSIAFPCLGTRIFKQDKEKAAAIFLRAIYQFVEDYSKESNFCVQAISIHHEQREKDTFEAYKEALLVSEK